MADAPDPESPQVEQGYFKVAHTLQVGLMLMSGHQESKVILCEIVGQWFGKGRATTFTVNVTKIAERWGLDRRNVSRGFRQLKTDGVLVAQDDRKSVKVNKYVLMQLLPENVRKGLESFAMDARNGEIFGEKIDPKYRVKNDTGDVSNLTQESVKNDAITASKMTQECVKSDAQKGGVYKEEEAEELKTTAKRVVADSRTSNPEEDAGLFPGNTRLDVQRVERWVEKIPNSIGYKHALTEKVHVWARSYSIGWIEEALRDAVAANPDKYGIYINRMLRTWKDAGGPDKEAERHQKAKSKPTGAALPTNVWTPPKTPQQPTAPAFQVDALKKLNPGMTDAQAVEILWNKAQERRRMTA